MKIISPAIDRMPFSVNLRAAAGLKQKKGRRNYVTVFQILQKMLPFH
jgi:hypothetical protein